MGGGSVLGAEQRLNHLIQRGGNFGRGRIRLLKAHHLDQFFVRVHADRGLTTAGRLVGEGAVHGRIGIDGELVKLKDDAGEVSLPYAQIHKAKLVLTDELLRQAQKH